MSSNIETDVNSRLTTQENANHIHARMFYKDHCYVHIPSAAEVKPKKQNNEAKLAPQPLTRSHHFYPRKKEKNSDDKECEISTCSTQIWRGSESHTRPDHTF